MNLASGHEVEVLEGEELAKQKRDFHGYADGLVRFNPGGWVLPQPFLRYADKYFKFEFQPSDVVIVTYPKCGTTWTQEIVWTMMNNPDLTNPRAKLPIFVRSPFLEFDMFWNSSVEEDNPILEGFNQTCPGRDPKDGICLQMAECAPQPRLIKTHLPLSLLPPSMLDTCKVIFVARNPKDMVISYYHHCRLLKVHGYKGTWEDFVEYFVNNSLAWGNYGLMVKEAWEQRNHPNMHFVFFEDLKADMIGEFKRLNDFLGTRLTPQQLEAVAQYTSFKEMKSRDAITNGMDKLNIVDMEYTKNKGGFFRKGKTGDWKDKYSPELMAKMDSWIEENIKIIDMDFKYSI